MTRPNRTLRLRRALAASLVAAPLAFTQAAHASVPEAIDVPAGNKRFLVGHAVGVQIYSCTATGWSFVAPRATLYDDHGKLLTTHFAGPTWQAKDGSKVVGRRVAGVNVDPTAIDWLLLAAASTEAGPDGDRLAHTTFIQRTNTTGGLAPAAPSCNAGTLGSTAEVPYTADYHFFKASGRGATSAAATG
jgi:Protein of unknown function (DUF3455)